MKWITKNDFFLILYGEHASFNITGLAYLGELGVWKRRGRARKRANSSTRTEISKKRGGQNHEKHAVPPVLDS